MQKIQNNEESNFKDNDESV
jgi:hypothetical protein